jgi:hypothetical protein
MARIFIIPVPPLDSNCWRYDVQVTESDGDGSKTTHQVTLDKEYYLDLTERARITPEEFIKKSFEFLLDRESRDSILKQFDLAQISDYFPEYEKEIRKALDSS